MEYQLAMPSRQATWSQCVTHVLVLRRRQWNEPPWWLWFCSMALLSRC